MIIPDHVLQTARARYLQAVRDAEGKKAAERRARVLSHPDLAERLCKVLGLADARHWRGHVPAGRPAGDRGAELIAICREALERDGRR